MIRLFQNRVGLLVAFLPVYIASALSDWQLEPFERVNEVNPIINPLVESIFHCPIHNKDVRWESDHTFNPAAVVCDNKVYLFYRAEDDSGKGIGQHSSRLGLAQSDDGIHFQRLKAPIFFPDNDEQKANEYPGGCEDPRIVETEEGGYVMTYTQWNRNQALLAVATSRDLFHWQKHGYAFQGKFPRQWSKSGSIVCRRDGDHLIATRIKGKYWMYWGEGSIYVAISDDLISWTPLLNKDGSLLAVLTTREGKFDSNLVEPGPPAIITNQGILLLYNGKNAKEKGNRNIKPGAYSAGQVLFDIFHPTRILERCDRHFLTPEKPFEMKGQYQAGTVFIEGLVHFQGNWLLYYGAADTLVGVAKCKARPLYRASP